MNSKAVLTIGTFDLLHTGHIDLFKHCYELANGGPVYVAVNTDEFVEKYKGKRPIIRLEDRLEMVSSIKYVTSVFTHSSGKDCKPTIETVLPQILVIGSDWLEKDYLKQIDIDVRYLEDRRITLAYTPRFEESTSAIKKRIINES